MTPLHLRRADPARNMRRFYRLEIPPDLFGRVMLSHGGGIIRQRGACPCRLAAAGRAQEAARVWGHSLESINRQRRHEYL